MGWLWRGGLALLTALLAGCTVVNAAPIARHSPPSWGQVQNWMARSPSWNAAQQRVAYPFYMEDGTDGAAVVVYVGEDVGDHVCRIATLRVWNDGRIERQEYDARGEFMWVDDR